MFAIPFPSLVYFLHPHLKQFKPCFDVLGIRGNEVARLYVVFRSISSKHRKHEFVEVASAMAYFNIGENKFMNKAFRALNFEGETYMDFRHFVILMWYYCTVTNNLHTLIFTVYDMDGNGMLNAEEADKMLRQIYGKYFEGSQNAQKLTKKVTELGRDGVAKLFFIEFCKRNPEVLEPAQKNISLLIKGSLGKKRWQRMSEHRKYLTKDKFMTIWDLIVKIQEKAGDDSDIFNVREAVAERAVKEKKRLKKKYSREYLQRESAKNRSKSISNNNLSDSDGGGNEGSSSPVRSANEADVVMIMDDMDPGQSSPSPSVKSESPIITKRKSASRSPSKKGMVVPAN